MKLFKQNKRGLVWVDGVGGGLINKGTEYHGYYEVEILEEAEGLCKVKFENAMMERSNDGKWLDKNIINIIKEK